MAVTILGRGWGLIAFGAKTPLAGTLTQQICPCLHKHGLVNYLKEQNNSPEKDSTRCGGAHLHISIPRSVLMRLGHNKSWSFIPTRLCANSHHCQHESPSSLKDEGIKGKQRGTDGEGNKKKYY